MKKFHYNLRFPSCEPHLLSQDEAYFILQEDGIETTIRFHEYAKLFDRPGLYEQLFYDRLKCISPTKVCDLLENVLHQNHAEMSELRVLDVGAGNGMAGEILMKKGIARLIGIDILDEARDACERDRPGVYDAYYVTDLTALDQTTKHALEEWRTDCMITIAALGFHDIPPIAFAVAFNLVQDGGWIAFNIKETFLHDTDSSGFSRLVKDMLVSDILAVHHLERYRHRFSIDGRPLYYYALIGRKEKPIPLDTLVRYGEA